MDEKNETCGCFNQLLERRTVLKAALGMALGLPFIDFAVAQQTNPTEAPPEEGDQFVFAFGNRKGEIITPKDPPLGGPQVIAYPMDPKTNTVKDGTPFNKVLLLRLDPKELSEETRARSAEGIVAYTAICTHLGCDIKGWTRATETLVCHCHFSKFDPKNGARVIGGPAPRRLPALPLKIEDGVLIAADRFSAKVGFMQG